MEAETDPSLLRALQDFVTLRTLLELHAYGVEKFAVENSESLGPHSIGEIFCQPMNFLGDGAQSAWAVINRIHRRDHGEEHLRCADVTGGFIAANVLFAGLKREPIAWSAGGIVRNADESSWHVPFVGITRCEIGGVRSAKTERNAEALGAADRDISAHFARRF